MNLFLKILSWPTTCTRFFRATGSSFFSQTHSYTEVSDSKDGEVSLAAAPGPEYGNGSLKCFDPVSLCSQKKIPQHIPSLISCLHVFHHHFFFFCTFPPFYVQPYLTNDPNVWGVFFPFKAAQHMTLSLVRSPI